MHSAFTSLNLNEGIFEEALFLQFGAFALGVKSNHRGLLEDLSNYFAPHVVANAESSITVYLYEHVPLDTDLPWKDWPREAGKTGLKEQISDIHDGRWVHKFKTGMVFFQHLTSPLAVGPCSQHQSQIINFIINQHINYLQQQGGLICHAACLQVKGEGIAIGAYSGGGKSTTMLKLMEDPSARFVSNDRLFLFAEQGKVRASGVAKQPRVNPGTLLNNARLRGVLPKARQRQLETMEKPALWSLEEKYDVMVAQHYGNDKVMSDTSLGHVVLLNWEPQSGESVALEPVDIEKRKELVAAIAKSPGPFYQNREGDFLTEADLPPASDYIHMLSKLQVWEVTGGADFEALGRLIEERLL